MAPSTHTALSAVRRAFRAGRPRSLGDAAAGLTTLWLHGPATTAGSLFVGGAWGLVAVRRSAVVERSLTAVRATGDAPRSPRAATDESADYPA